MSQGQDPGLAHALVPFCNIDRIREVPTEAMAERRGFAASIGAASTGDEKNTVP